MQRDLALSIFRWIYALTYTTIAAIVLHGEYEYIASCAFLGPFVLVYVCNCWVFALGYSATLLRNQSAETERLKNHMWSMSFALFICATLITSRYLNDDESWVDEHGLRHDASCRDFYDDMSPNLLFLFDMTYYIYVQFMMALLILYECASCHTSQTVNQEELEEITS